MDGACRADEDTCLTLAGFACGCRGILVSAEKALAAAKKMPAWQRRGNNVRIISFVAKLW